MRIALKTAYDGRFFRGSQVQPDQRTVEGELMVALRTVLGKEGMQHANLKASSRTDAGVSALGNVFCISADMPPETLARALNANLEGIWIHSFVEVDEGFNPRHARKRVYRYFLPRISIGHGGEGAVLEGSRELDGLRDAVGLFIGEHDFTSFCKMEEGRNPVRCIDAFTVKDNGNESGTGNFYVFEVVGQSFLWHMVRKMVGTAAMHAQDRIGLDEIRDALDGGRPGTRTGYVKEKRRQTFDPDVATAEWLVLWDVKYDGYQFTDVQPIEKMANSIDAAMLEAEFSMNFYRKLNGMIW
jgi:tRNA pseudouridine38-40 synthase